MNKKLFVSPKFFSTLEKEHSFLHEQNIQLHSLEEEILQKSNQESLLNGENSLVIFWIGESEEQQCSLLEKLISKEISNETFFLLEEEGKQDKAISEQIKKKFKTLDLKSLSKEKLRITILQAFQNLETRKENFQLKKALSQKNQIIQKLSQIGRALAMEKNPKFLLRFILQKSQEVLGCDVCTLYLIEEEKGNKVLRFKISQILNSPTIGEDEHLLKIDETSIAGYVALHDKALNLEDVSNLDPDLPYKHNFYYDEKIDYKSQSMIALPIKNIRQEIIGVLQFINKQKYPVLNLFEENNEIIPFSDQDLELAMYFMGQTAVAIESIDLQEQFQNIHKITQIGKALATERNYSKLLRFILSKSKEVTHCDAGSIYLVQRNSKGEKIMTFQSSDLDLHSKKDFSFPLDKKSIAGYVAITGKILNIRDAYQLPKDAEYTLNLEYDKRTNYRTHSMLVVPMRNQKNEIIGVLQLINKLKKQSFSSEFADDHLESIPFDDKDIELSSSVAGQAAVAIENNLLYRDIQRLFEGFVRASVKAIESRDPITSGHSERVASYSVALATKVSEIQTGTYELISFTADQIKELRYAALLHDFGKVGVRERILTKAEKLYPYELEKIRDRFELIRKMIQRDSFHRILQSILQKKIDPSIEKIQEILQNEETTVKKSFAKLESTLYQVVQSNNPKIIESEVNKLLFEIAQENYVSSFDGEKVPFLLARELEFLSVKKGSLGKKERKEIQSHVQHSFEFLAQIPWTQELKEIPMIAYAHHEKLDGSGYPRGLRKEKIPIQAKIITVTDIFDALVSPDRPYKRKLPIKKALMILVEEAKKGALDQDIVQIFIDNLLYIQESINSK